MIGDKKGGIVVTKWALNVVTDQSGDEMGCILLELTYGFKPVLQMTESSKRNCPWVKSNQPLGHY